MPTLRPFRDYDEKDVINLFAFEVAAGEALPMNKGTLVKVGTGWTTDQELAMLGDVGASYSNTVSQRYGVAAKVATAGAGETPLGMTLFDTKETDENGELLKFNPRKAAEMEAVLTGQAVPVVTRGIFLYSGATLASETPVAGSKLYCGAAGEITTGSAGNVQVGTALGGKNTASHVLLKLSL
jgi:hypothetical protein